MGATCHRFFLAAHRLIDCVAVDEHFTAPDDVKRKLMGCHGITSSPLSSTAIRVGEILGSILDRGPEPARGEPRPVADGVGPVR